MDTSSWVYLTDPLFTKRERWHEKRRGEETEKGGFAMSQICGNGTWKVELTKFKSLVHMKQYVQQEGLLQSKKKKKTTNTQFVRLLLGYVNKLLGWYLSKMIIIYKSSSIVAICPAISSSCCNFCCCLFVCLLLSIVLERLASAAVVPCCSKVCDSSGWVVFVWPPQVV